MRPDIEYYSLSRSLQSFESSQLLSLSCRVFPRMGKLGGLGGNFLKTSGMANCKDDEQSECDACSYGVGLPDCLDDGSTLAQ
jgi:hypothetical protein